MRDGLHRGPTRDYSVAWAAAIASGKHFRDDQELSEDLAARGGGTAREALEWVEMNTLKGKDIAELREKYKQRIKEQ